MQQACASHIAAAPASSSIPLPCWRYRGATFLRLVLEAHLPNDAKDPNNGAQWCVPDCRVSDAYIAGKLAAACCWPPGTAHSAYAWGCPLAEPEPGGPARSCHAVPLALYWAAIDAVIAHVCATLCCAVLCRYKGARAVRRCQVATGSGAC